MRWHGWGVEGRAYPLRADARAALLATLGAAPRAPRPLPEPPALPGPVLLTPPAKASAEPPDRLTHSAGKSTPDLLRARMGRSLAAPDAVAWPASHDEVAGVLAWAEREGVAVVPFGGGSSVVGGVAPERGPHRACLSLDLTRLDALLELDDQAQLARLQCGILGPALEHALDHMDPAPGI